MWRLTKDLVFFVTLLRNIIDAVLETIDEFGVDFDGSIEEEEELLED